MRRAFSVRRTTRKRALCLGIGIPCSRVPGSQPSAERNRESLLSGEVEMQEYKKTRKVLEVKVTRRKAMMRCTSRKRRKTCGSCSSISTCRTLEISEAVFLSWLISNASVLDRLARRYGFRFRNFQRDDIARLLLKGGGMLCWEQGCGKTLGGMAFAKGIMDKSISQSARRGVVHCPAGPRAAVATRSKEVFQTAASSHRRDYGCQESVPAFQTNPVSRRLVHYLVRSPVTQRSNK